MKAAESKVAAEAAKCSELRKELELRDKGTAAWAVQGKLRLAMQQLGRPQLSAFFVALAGDRAGRAPAAEGAPPLS